MRASVRTLLGTLIVFAGCAAPPSPPPATSQVATVRPVTAPPVATPKPVAPKPVATQAAGGPPLVATLQALRAVVHPTPTPSFLGELPPAPALQIVASPGVAAALQDLADEYLAANGAARLELNVGGQRALLDVYREGLSVDILATDDPAQIAALRAANLLDGEPRTLTRAPLSVVTKAANAKQIASVKDLASDGIRWLAFESSTPVGMATMRMLDNASAQPDYGSGFRAQAERNVQARLRTPDEVLERLFESDVAAAVLLRSDVPLEARQEFKVIDIPDDINAQIDVPIVTVKGRNPGLAAAFASYVQSAAAAQVFARHGFVSAPAPGSQRAAEIGARAASPSFEVRGLVASPRRFTRADIEALPQESVRVNYATDGGAETATFTGTRLLNVFNAAGGARLPTDVENAKLRLFISVRGADTSEIVLDWGLLDPDFGAQDVLVAIDRDGAPLSDQQGMARLIVPYDRRAGRSLPAITLIEIRDPGPAATSVAP